MDIKTMLHMCKLKNHQEGKHITILGAGVAGLVAAYELEQLGHQVDIMEGSPRIGGRVWTHRFENASLSTYGELGAMRIPSEHKYVLHYVDRMQLTDKLCKFITVFEEKNALISRHGQVFRMKEASKIFQEYFQTTFGNKKYSQSTYIFAAWFKTIVEAISPESLRSSFNNALHANLMDDLERLDLEIFFNDDGYTIDLHKFIQAYPNLRSRCSKAVDMFLDDILVETSHDLLRLEGGMDQLVQQIAAKVQGSIKCNQEIVAISTFEDGVKITWLENGSLHTRFCDYVLCTIPFSVLRKIRLSGFDDNKLKSLQQMVYCPATKVLFHCAQPFWKNLGIRGGASFVDQGIRQIYYPSVGDYNFRNSTLLASYTIGEDAKLLEIMPDQERYTYVKNAVSQLHPEIEIPGMLLSMATVAWGKYKWCAGGCSISWGGNMYSNNHYAHYLEAARPQNRLFFAGEHCSRYPAWVQGAIESAIAAVYQIVSHKTSMESNTVNSLIPLS